MTLYLIIVALVVVGVSVTALSSVRAQRNPTPGNQSITAAFALTTLAGLLWIPAVGTAVNTTTHVDNLAHVLSTVCVVLWCAAIQTAMLDLVYNGAALRWAVLQRWSITGAVLLVMCVTFIIGNSPDVDFTTTYVNDHQVMIYLVVYVLWAFATFAELAVRCARISAATSPMHPWTSIGYAISTLAAVAGMAYCISRGGYLVSHVLGHAWSLEREQLLSPILIMIAFIFFFIGFTLPLVGTWLGQREGPQNRSWGPPGDS